MSWWMATKRGKKYAATVRSLLNNDREEEREHLTALPALDMEHFMYRQGFADVFSPGCAASA
ncbi:putative ATP-dependent endonuclease of the OLDfamily YbjD subgroup [Salmonella enterica subsp. enterica]|uniref:Putative ATP-dependent endonuclease of the OLDfamily YbjD subgroup n=1 Tax=Salmonella enterica I TaxID=59201 RepID=A0A379VUX5_SALET|nr:putative ATP-dependent endonuclease of the OLDfamily YbjD subgroup [Salmonella enterica subsp. enterica]